MSGVYTSVIYTFLELSFSTINNYISASLVFPQTFLPPVHPDELRPADLLVAGHGDPAGEDLRRHTGTVD